MSDLCFASTITTGHCGRKLLFWGVLPSIVVFLAVFSDWYDWFSQGCVQVLVFCKITCISFGYILCYCAGAVAPGLPVQKPLRPVFWVVYVIFVIFGFCMLFSVLPKF